MRADLILAGGVVRTLGRAGLRTSTHLAVAGGRVLAAGGSELMALRGPRTRVVALRGAAVLPGFNEAHAHVVYYGLTRFGADLGPARNVADIVERLRTHARRLKPGEWQQGMGYRASALAEKRPPHRRELDQGTGGRPAFIDERGGHSRVANTAALRAAGITASTPDPLGGRIGRDPDGTPNGLLQEAAMRMVADVQPLPDRRRRSEAILKAQKLLLSRGITSVGAAVNRGFADDLFCYARLASNDELHMRVNEFLSWELLDAASSLGVHAGFGGDVVRAGPIKVFVDGGAERVMTRLVGGMWRTPPDELKALLRQASRAGLQVAAHAIGDGAIEAMCDAVEAAGVSGLRHRVEHCTICPPDLQRRLARLGMIAVMQPLVLRAPRVAPGVFPEVPREDFAPHRALARAGVRIAFSSDLPVTPDPNPWPGIQAAVEDQVNGVSVLTAIRAYTAGGAYATFEEAVKGTLEPGMLADLQVYASDPLAVPAADMDVLRPQAVLLGGSVVWGEL
ncbi:MAG TPA: amidohydrolase [Candidatus Dormibacteraeota bacterium]|nr:amidohydrolase [Candidatus Dormibacteraeota bacterium]